MTAKVYNFLLECEQTVAKMCYVWDFKRFPVA